MDEVGLTYQQRVKRYIEANEGKQVFIECHNLNADKFKDFPEILLLINPHYSLDGFLIGNEEDLIKKK